MNRNLAIKLGVIGLLIILLMIPLLLIGGMVSDRQALRDGVLADIARSSSAAQALKDEGALKVVAYITHPVLSGGAVERISQSALDELVERTGLGVAAVSSMLLLLELEGTVAPAGNGRWQRFFASGA